MIKLYVIVVTYNGRIWYDRCFNSLRNSQMPLQTIAIDNASSDDTVIYIKKNFPEIVLIESFKNLGFGQANNQGIRYALDCGADYVFLLNQDAWIEPFTLTELVRIHKENPNYGILSPINVSKEKNTIIDGFIQLIADYENTDCNLLNDLYFDKLKDVYAIKSVNAAAWLLPRKILNNVGGFDPIFFHYGEDDNYLQRAHFHGFGVGICPKLTIVHDTVVSVQFNQHMKKDGYKRNVLILCGNVNNNLSEPNKYIKFLIRSLFIKAVSFKKKAFLHYYKELKYLLAVKKNVDYSRKINKTRGESWLMPS